jgi:phospholipase D1/2
VKKKTRRKSRTTRPAWGKIAIIAGVILALFIAWRFTPLADVITAERVSAFARAVGRSPWSPFVLAAAYVPASFVMFPRPLLTLFAVIAFGPWIGFATSIGGIMAAELAGYSLGRALPQKTLGNVAGDKLASTRTALRKHGLSAAFAFSIVPIAPAPVVSAIAGAARIKVWQFVLGTTLGMLPGTLATTLFADQLAKVFDDAEQINWWIVAGVIMGFVALTLLVRKWVQRRMLS